MELRQLRSFVAVASEGTYLAAALTLHIAQPALWRQVHELELELGTPLFERVGRRVRITRDGEQLRVLAGAAIEAADRLSAAASDLRSATAGTLVITCAAPHLREALAPIIAAFRTAHPGVRIDVREYLGGPGPGRGMREDLLDGIADLATGVPEDDSRFESIPLYRGRIVLAVDDNHPWRHAGVVDVERLRGVPLVTALPGSYSRSVLDDAARRAGFEPTIVFASPNPVSILAIGRTGLGIPMLVEDALDHPVDPPWPAIGEGGREIEHRIRLGWRAGVPRSAAAAAFVALVPASNAANDAQAPLSAAGPPAS
jgi:DNA-binding transcriptional LysR family regulator